MKTMSKLQGPERAKQESPGREPRVGDCWRLEPCKGDAMSYFARPWVWARKIF